MIDFFLDLKAQQARVAPALRRRLEAVLAHCQFVLGPEVAEVERDLAARCGARHCVGVSSGTDALQIAMMAEGIGRGDAVFLPAFTYTATAEVPLDDLATYRVVANGFLSEGGDNFPTFRAGANKLDGGLDIDALRTYLLANNPYTPLPTDRISQQP